MNFRTVATLGMTVSAIFGVAFLLAAGPSAASYGGPANDPFVAVLGRYFGSELLLFAAALWALRDATDPVLCRRAALGIAVGSVIGLVVTLQGLQAGALNAMGWSSVAVYAFFVAAWGRLAMARAPGGRRQAA